ncbi:PREDICTED: uncharacterized protein LOC102016543 [Chinchilla lanigera]|uniref:uncharacterized protein LOC102016543 n=1 Tax=Chinchilla lanigera TaxID=34839 RepID=UPI000696C301|nr:PREDICTED: uncharacterized protein LOC102016543 [Chinchilla lanigera]
MGLPFLLWLCVRLCVPRHAVLSGDDRTKTQKSFLSPTELHAVSTTEATTTSPRRSREGPGAPGIALPVVSGVIVLLAAYLVYKYARCGWSRSAERLGVAEPDTAHRPPRLFCKPGAAPDDTPQSSSSSKEPEEGATVRSTGEDTMSSTQDIETAVPLQPQTLGKEDPGTASGRGLNAGCVCSWEELPLCSSHPHHLPPAQGWAHSWGLGEPPSRGCSPPPFDVAKLPGPGPHPSTGLMPQGERCGQSLCPTTEHKRVLSARVQGPPRVPQNLQGLEGAALLSAREEPSHSGVRLSNARSVKREMRAGGEREPQSQHSAAPATQGGTRPPVLPPAQQSLPSLGSRRRGGP